MSGGLIEWNRPKYQPGGGTPFLYFSVYGNPRVDAPLSRSKYRVGEIPAGLDLYRLDRREHASRLDYPLDPPLGDVLKEGTPEVETLIRSSQCCCELRGDIIAASNLNYLRDAIGLIQWLLDHGGTLVYDPQQLRCWTPAQWHDEVFAPGTCQPQRHVVTLLSREDPAGLSWYHTRGMRQFGRPDISIRHVPLAFGAQASDLCDRIIRLQAEGAIIADEEPIRVSGWPQSSVVRHAGDLDDPDFNNVHLEIVVDGWPVR